MSATGPALRRRVLVEVWSDVVCPWCHVGKARFEQALRELEWGDEVTVVYRPFELDRNVPPEGVDLGEYLQRKFGRGVSIEAVEGRVAEAGAEQRLTFDWSKVRRVNTFDAHRLLAWALATAGPEVQAELKLRLMESYFGEGGDVSDHATLSHLAGEVGLDADTAAKVLASDDFAVTVRDAERFAWESQITAVPTYVIERAYAIPGAQEPDTFKAVLERARQRLVPAPASAAAVDACSLDDPNAC